MINYVLSYLTLAVLFVLRTTLGEYIDICGIAPNLMFVYILCYSMYNFPVRSAILCVSAGILIDIYSMEYIGLNALLYMYTGLAISNFASALIKKNVWTASVGVLVVSALYHTVILVVSYALPRGIDFAYPFVRFVLPTALYDAVVSFAIALWARCLSEEKIRGL